MVLPEIKEVDALTKEAGVELFEMASDPRWTEQYYRPNGIYPTVDGNTVLALILSEKILSLVAK